MGYSVFKRIFDIVFSSLGILLLSPVGLLVSALIKLSDGGPVFYTQIRIGQFGKPFRMWKFRSMVVNAEKLGMPVTQGKDPRVTRVGRTLRNTKLDELPQLWNVLRGEMSFVGPRPEVPRYVELYSPQQREILQYKPGITDRATLLFRNEETLLSGADDLEAFYLRYCLPKKIDLNLEYEHRATMLRDVWIILQTLCPYWLGVFFVYVVTLVFSFWAAYLLRSDFALTATEHREFIHFLPLIVLPQILFLVWRGQLRGLLSYFSVPEMRRTITALSLAFLVQIVICRSWRPPDAPSTSIILMDLILAFFAVCGVRMGFRLVREHLSTNSAGSLAPARRVAIIGTGELATNLVLDFERSEHPPREVIAFFDDDPYTWHKRPYGIPVVGMPECLLNKEWVGKVDEVIVTLPEKDAERIRQISRMLKPLPVKVTIASGWPVLQPVQA